MRTPILLLLPALSLVASQAAPFSSLADFNQSLPACARAVQDQVFAQALGMAPYGCSATMDPIDLVKSTNSTDMLCICTTARVPLTAPLESFTVGAPAFEEVAAAACSMSTTDITKTEAESELFIELCMGVANGTWAGDLASKGATQTPAAGKCREYSCIKPQGTNNLTAASVASGTSWVSSLLLAIGSATLVAAGLI